jgi:hypothetical protein
VLDYDTDSKERVEVLMNSDLIFYVCANVSELDYICAEESMKIGQSSFDDDYNRLHHIGRFKKKCIDLAFSTRQYPNKIIPNTNLNTDESECERFITNQVLPNVSYQDDDEENCPSLKRKIILPSQINEFIHSLKCTQHKETQTEPTGLVSKLNMLLSELVFSRLTRSISNRIRNKINCFKLEQLTFVNKHSVHPSESFSWI